MKIINKNKSLIINDLFDLNLTLFVLPSHKRIMHTSIYKSEKIHVNLPNICFILFSLYNKNTKKYIYAGQPCSSLNVCCSENPIDLNIINYNDLYYVNGYFSTVCTNHDYDNKEFNSIEEMINFLANEFLSLKICNPKLQDNNYYPLKNFITHSGFSDSYDEHLNYFNNNYTNHKIKLYWDENKILPYTMPLTFFQRRYNISYI